MVYDLIIIAGEPSGDEHASHILKALYRQNPNLKIAAVSGPHMKAAYPMDEILNIDQLSIMGFVDVVLNFRKLFSIYRKIFNFILSNPSKGVLFVDYPGMNLKLAQNLKKRAYSGKLWHFIAPTAWAWKKNRTQTLKESIDQLFCILPFEESFFQSHGVTAQYVGNPLVEKISKNKVSIERDPNLIGVFPGSRAHEITKNLPLVIKALSLFISKHPSFRVGISCANEKTKSLIQHYLSKAHVKFSIELFSQEDSQHLMQKARFAIAKSGTCNLELGLYKTPSVIVYAISKLDVFIARKILKIQLPFFSLPNLILNQEIYQELYGPNFQLETLLSSIETMVIDTSMILEKTEKLSSVLGELNPGQIVADQINLNL